MKNKISVSGSAWKYSGFTKMSYWTTQFTLNISIFLGLAFLANAFVSKDTSDFESLLILVLIGVGFFVGGIVTSLLAIFNLLFFSGADKLGLLSKNDDDVVV